MENLRKPQKNYEKLGKNSEKLKKTWPHEPTSVCAAQEKETLRKTGDVLLKLFFLRCGRLVVFFMKKGKHIKIRTKKES